MKTLIVSRKGFDYTLSIHNNILSVSSGDTTAKEEMTAYECLHDSDSILDTDSILAFNVKFIFLMIERVSLKERRGMIDYEIDDLLRTIVEHFLLKEDDEETIPKTLSEFAIKHNVLDSDNNIDLKNLGVIFDDMKSSSIYRAVHDVTYKTSSSLVKKIELMDFILTNTSNTKYHLILK